MCVPTQVDPACICKLPISNPACSTIFSFYHGYGRHWHDAASFDRQHPHTDDVYVFLSRTGIRNLILYVMVLSICMGKGGFSLQQAAGSQISLKLKQS